METYNTGFENDKSPKHLKEGVRPIMACIGTLDQFQEDENKRRFGIWDEVFDERSAKRHNKSHARNVDYYESPNNLKEQNYKNAGKYSYVISPIDNSNKFSEKFRNCTGLIVTGQDKSTGENISFLSHQDPHYFLTLKDNKNHFVEDLRQQLSALKEKCLEGTIDAIIVGGNYIEDFGEFADEQQYKKDYLESIALLSSEVSRSLGFEPIVMTGPKTFPDGGKDDVYYDNEHRRIYIIRPSYDIGKESTKSFAPGDVDEQKKKW